MMKIFLLRALAIAVGFPAAAFAVVIAFHYGQDFHEWFVEIMEWESRDLGSYALAFLLAFSGVIGGFYLLAATLLIPFDVFKEAKTEKAVDGSR